MDISPCLFTVDELAHLLALFPEDLKENNTISYMVGSIIDVDKTKTTYYFLCKGKKKCVKGIDDKRFEKYLNDFSELLKKNRPE